MHISNLAVRTNLLLWLFSPIFAELSLPYYHCVTIFLGVVKRHHENVKAEKLSEICFKETFLTADSWRSEDIIRTLAKSVKENVLILACKNRKECSCVKSMVITSLFCSLFK